MCRVLRRRRANGRRHDAFAADPGGPSTAEASDDSCHPLHGLSRTSAGSGKLEAGSGKLEAGSWKREAGSWKLEVGGEVRVAAADAATRPALPREVAVQLVVPEHAHGV